MFSVNIILPNYTSLYFVLLILYVLYYYRQKKLMNNDSFYQISLCLSGPSMQVHLEIGNISASLNRISYSKRTSTPPST